MVRRKVPEMAPSEQKTAGSGGVRGRFTAMANSQPSDSTPALGGSTRRRHGEHFYLPGWEVPKLEPRLLTDHYGFVSDFLSEAFHQLRKRTFVNAIDGEFSLGPHLAERDVKAVRKTVSGLLKILHPDGEWTRAELREYLEWAMEGRRRVKEQLKKLAAHDFSKTSFTYSEVDTGREYAVEVPEQPEETFTDDSFDETETPTSDKDTTAPRTIAEILAGGEGRTVEFKSTARVNLATGQRDTAIEMSVIKTVAGFLNAHGGTLLVGIADDATVRGLKEDFIATGNKGRDGYENVLTSLVESSIGRAAGTLVHISFETFADGEVCRLNVHPSNEPVFERNSKGDADLYVRINNSTRLLNTADALSYIKKHFR